MTTVASGQEAVAMIESDVIKYSALVTNVNLKRMIPVCSPSDSVLFTPKMPATESHSNFSRSPFMIYKTANPPIWIVYSNSAEH